MALDPVSRKFTGGAYPVGYGATAVAYDGTNRDLYVTDQYGGNVSVISPASGAVATVVIGAQQGPIALAVNPVGNLVYVANYNGSSVSVIGGSTNRLVTSAPVGASPDALTYDPRSNLLYVANCGSNNVSVLNGTSLAPLKSIPVGECPSDLTIDATTNELLVANFYSPTGGYSNVTFVNLSSGLSDGSVATAFGAKALCIDPANGYLYVANAGSSNLTIVNLSSRSQAAPGIPVDQWPEQSYPTTITYDPIEQDLVIPTVFASAVYVVGDVPSLRALNVSPDPGEVGVATEIVVQGAGGTAPYSVQFSGLPPGCPGLDSFALLCTPLVSGNFTVTATLTDAHGFPVLGSAGFPVAPALTLIAVLAVPGEIDQGSSSVISGDVAGGVPPLSYSYAGLPPGCTSVDRPTLSCAPSVAGTYSVRLIVTDDLRVQAVGAVAIVVHPGLNVTLLSPNGGSAVVGQSVDFFATVSGGASPFLYSYSGLPPGCSAVNGPVAQCNLTTAGRWEPIVNVTDSTGRTGQGQGTLVVDPYVVAPEIAAFYADPSNFALGTSTTLFVVVTGTAGPWALEFSNLPLGCTSGNSTSLACTPRQIGTYTINVTLSSRGSVRASASTSMTVHPSPVSPAAGPPAWDWLYGVAIGATGAAVVGLMALGLVRRRRPRRPPEVSVPPEPLPP
jgi:YVTN family beta-propeller protein